MSAKCPDCHRPYFDAFSRRDHERVPRVACLNRQLAQSLTKNKRLQAELSDVRDHQLGAQEVAYDLARNRADALQTIVDKLQLVRREATRFINGGKVVDPDDVERLCIAIRCVEAVEAAGKDNKT